MHRHVAVIENASTRRVLALALAAGVLVLVAVTALWQPHSDGEPSVPTTATPSSQHIQPPSRVAPALETTAPPKEDPSGYIVDEVGQPVSGVTVSVLNDEDVVLRTSAASLESGAFFLGSKEYSESTGPLRLRVRIEGPGIISAEASMLADLVPHIMVSRLAQLSVRVRTADGTPAANARVRLLSGADEGGTSGETNAKGLALFTDLAPGTYQVWAAGAATITPLETVQAHREDETASPLDLQLGPAARVTGRVQSATGLGVASTIRLIPIGHEHAVFLAKSDSSGQFVFSHVPRGDWQVQVSAPGFSQRSDKRINTAGPPSYLELEMMDDASVQGLVVDERGAPVVGAQIRVTPLGQSKAPVTSQPVGTAPGLRWIHPLAGARHLPLRDSRRFGAGRDGVRPPECGRGHCGVDLGGERGWPVLAANDGVAVAASDDDRGKSGRYVALEHAGGMKTFYMHLDSVATNIKVGTVVPAGTILGTLGRSGVQHSEPHLHFALSRQEAGQAFFLDPEPMLRFAVVLPAPPETPGLDLPNLVLARHTGKTEGKLGTGQAALVRSDSSGRFHREGLHPGKYQVSVVHPELASGKSRGFVVRSGQDLQGVRVVLRTGVRVQGQVIGPAGPVADAWIRVFQGEGESRQALAQASVDVDGRFTLRPVAGPVELEVGAAGFGVLLKSLPNRRQQQREQLLRLSPFDSELRGQVQAPGGTAAAGAQVQILSGPGGRARRTLADEDGFFHFDHLPSGAYRVRIRSNDYPEFEANMVSGEFPVIVLPRGGALRLVIRDYHNREPVIGVRVSAEGPGGRTTTGLTAPNGQVDLSPLLPGKWRVSVESSEHISFQENFRVMASEAHPAPLQTLELRRGARLSGVLRDAAGERISGARVWLGRAEARTDRDGRFQLLRVDTGEVMLRASQGNARAALPLELFAGDEQVTLELRLREDAEDFVEDAESTEDAPEEEEVGETQEDNDG